MSTLQSVDYFRRDQSHGITAPNLLIDCTYADHIVRTRGKRTRFTSLSLDRSKIDDFGPALYLVLKLEVIQDRHSIVEHADLIASLREAAESSDKADRVKAIQAQRYATRRQEGLVDWVFDYGSIERKELVTWAFNKIQKYFRKL